MGSKGQGMGEEAAADDRATGRQRTGWTAWWFGLAAVVAVLAALTAVAVIVVVASPDGVGPERVIAEPPVGEQPRETPSEALDWSEVLAHIDVTAQDFRRDWNRFVEALGFGHELDQFTFPEHPYGMGAQTHAFPDGSELEVIEHPDGFLSRMELRGEPTDVDEAVDYLAMVYALIHATSGMDTDEVVAFAGTELGLDETVDEGNHTQRARIDGVAYEFNAFQGQWLVWAGSTDDSP